MPLSQEYRIIYEEAFANMPLHQFMGIKLIDFADGTAETRTPMSANLENAIGRLHGGVQYVICDITGAAAVASMVGDKKFLVTNDIHISVVRTISSGELVARAKVLRMGRRLAFVESRIYDENDILLSSAQVTKTLLDPR